MHGTSIPQAFDEQVRRSPDVEAVRAGRTRLTYRELDARASRVAHTLIELGVTSEEPVAVLIGQSENVAVAFLAVLKAGGCYLPLHRAYPSDRMRWILSNARPRVLLTDSRSRDLSVADCDVVVDLDEEIATAVGPIPDPSLSVHPDQLAYVMFTSGSTGRPKGIGVSHQSVLRLVFDSIWDKGNHAVVPMLAPAAFDVSTYELWVPLLRGGTVLIPDEERLDVGTVRRLVATGNVTTLHLTAGLFRVIAEEDPDSLAGVGEVMTGGDVVSPTAVRQVLDACPDTVVRALYGPTEATLFTTEAVLDDVATTHTVPIGRPFAGARCYVLDERLSPVADGECGELYIGGGRLARGYYGRPDLTAERFVANPFRGRGERMYRTGDLVRLRPGGVLEFVGRSDDQVKVRGFRVEPGEVEAVLRELDEIGDVAVIAREAAGDKQLVAYVVTDAESLDTAALRSYASSRLPEYMVPSAFVPIGALPLTANGKLDRDALPAPDSPGLSRQGEGRTNLETTIAELFAEVLGVAKVGAEDDFFELGGQSLLAMRLLTRIKSTIGVEVAIGELFDVSTVAGLATVIEQSSTRGRPAFVAGTSGRNTEYREAS